MTVIFYTRLDREKILGLQDANLLNFETRYQAEELHLKISPGQKRQINTTPYKR